MRLPKKQGLYDPKNEHDSCGVGFVCNIKGNKSFDIIKKGIEVLERMSHRGAVGADPLTGDGAGILIQIPHKFFINNGINLPFNGKYGAGLVFLPTDKIEQEFCKSAVERIIKKEGQKFLGWRKVPVNESVIGKTALESKPEFMQVFIGQGKESESQLVFERKLYIIRKKIENYIFKQSLKQKNFFYITSLSSKTLIYKGLLMPNQVMEFLLI